MGEPSVRCASITTRIRSDFAEALKEGSLEGQLKGIEPNTVQEMIEDADGTRLRTNGLIS